jgi:adenine C2-methylase RlmN of 23S rRNA A2503 and tRNA A37
MLLAKRVLFEAAAIPWVGGIVVEAALKRQLTSRAVTPEKVRNFLLAHRESRAKAIEVGSLPYILNLDTTNLCNLACPFCPTGTKQLKRKKTMLSLEDAISVIDRVRSHVLTIRLYNWGEPFLNRTIWSAQTSA